MIVRKRPRHSNQNSYIEPSARFIQFVALSVALSTLMAYSAESADQAKSRLILGNLTPVDNGAGLNGTALGGVAEDRQAQGDNGFWVLDASGAPGTPIPLKISLPSPVLDEYTFVMLRGLGKVLTLSSGFQTKDAWAVSLRDLPGLALISPSDFNGIVELEVQLIRGREAAPETRKLTVSISKPGINPATATINGSEVLTAAPPANTLALKADPLGLKDDQEEEKTGLVTGPKGISEAEETALLNRASQILKNSDVSAARLLFEHLAGRGSAKGAFAMGQTYDPDFLKMLFVRGLKADVEKAKAWYRRSIELGGGEAQARLSALDAQN